MLSNVTDPKILPALPIVATSELDTTGVIEPYKICFRDGTLPAAGTLAGGDLPDGVSGTEGTGDTGEYFSLIKREVAVVQVEAGAVIAFNDPIAVADTGTGNARLGVAGTDYIIGKSEDISDGSGTALDPHYIRVNLYL